MSATFLFLLVFGTNIRAGTWLASVYPFSLERRKNSLQGEQGMARGPQKMESGQVGRPKVPLVEADSPWGIVTESYSHGQSGPSQGLARDSGLDPAAGLVLGGSRG